MDEMLKYVVNGQIFRAAVEVRRFAEYFWLVPSVEDVLEANINVVGDRRMPVFRELNERAI